MAKKPPGWGIGEIRIPLFNINFIVVKYFVGIIEIIYIYKTDPGNFQENICLS